MGITLSSPRNSTFLLRSIAPLRAPNQASTLFFHSSSGACARIFICALDVAEDTQHPFTSHMVWSTLLSLRDIFQQQTAAFFPKCSAQAIVWIPLIHSSVAQASVLGSQGGVLHGQGLGPWQVCPNLSMFSLSSMPMMTYWLASFTWTMLGFLSIRSCFSQDIPRSKEPNEPHTNASLTQRPSFELVFEVVAVLFLIALWNGNIGMAGSGHAHHQIAM